MSNKSKVVRNISRRDTLKVCLVPAGAIGARWLAGCSSEKMTLDSSLTQPMAPAPIAGATPAAQGGAAGQSLTSGASTTSPATGVAGTSAAPPATGSSGGASGNTGANAQAGASGNTGANAQAGTSSAANSGASGDAAGSGAGAAAPTSAGTGTSSGAGGVAGDAAGSGGLSGSGGSMAAGPDVMWATGGTKTMQGNYPDPFTPAALSMACTVYPSQTLGPCYAQMPMARQDISDGLDGLPVRLSFLVVRSSGCMPVPDASIDIWHSGSDGIYSAYATGTICNPGTMDVKSQMYCRGVQTTDAMGRADFSTVFPGWYTGRTIHIHFTIRLNGRESVTSQLYFEDDLTDEILAQGYYTPRGRRDTTNRTDMIFRSGNASPAQVVFSTAKRTDGVLHAWKVLSIA